MNICLLAPRFPYPQYGGDALRINEIAHYLKSKGHILTLVSFSDEEPPATEQASRLYDHIYYVRRRPRQSYFYSVIYFLLRRPMQCGYYHSKAYRKILSKAISEQQPDLYIAHLVRLTPYLERLGLQKQSIVEMTDALSRTYALSMNAEKGGLLKYVYYMEQRLIEKYEQHVIRTFPKIVLVSQADEDFLRAKSGGPAQSLCTLPNGVHCAPHISDRYDANRITFLGNMRTLQNQDAALYFANRIFPRVKEVFPSARFHIVGSLPPPKIQALASEDIVVSGFVDDLEAEIQQSALVVAPVRVAAGIQNKVLQAMACGVPVVLSELIAPAIPQLRDGENCIIAHDDDQFTAACLRLLQESTFRNTMAEQGYQMVRQHYDWSRKLEGYEELN